MISLFNKFIKSRYIIYIFFLFCANTKTPSLTFPSQLGSSLGDFTFRRNGLCSQTFNRLFGHNVFSFVCWLVICFLVAVLGWNWLNHTLVNLVALLNHFDLFRTSTAYLDLGPFLRTGRTSSSSGLFHNF